MRGCLAALFALATFPQSVLGQEKDDEGFLRGEFYTNAGRTIDNLKKQKKFPDNPDRIFDLSQFASRQSVADNYGQRISGLLRPEKSGKYTFWVSGDDRAELYLSTDDKPANKKKIAHLTSHTNGRQWDKQPSQKSAEIQLEAGKTYWIEVLHAEGSGGDHVAVTWQGPGVKKGAPIGKKYFAPVPGRKPIPVPVSTDKWQSHDIGEPSRPGSFKLLDKENIFVIEGGGRISPDPPDQFQYVHRKLEGDGSIVAEVLGLQHTDTRAKAGIMVREKLTDGARYVIVCVSPTYVGFFQRKQAGKTIEIIKDETVHEPRWIKLQRKGNQFIGSHSDDGTNWEELGTFTLELPENLSIGLAVSSQNIGTYTTAEFQNVEIEP